VKCNNIGALKETLASMGAKNEHLAGGQHKYTLPDGLIINIYNTGSIVINGKNTDSEQAKAIENRIQSINDLGV
jgi:ribonuclease HIII